MSTISAGTTTGQALVSTGDITGQLVLQTNGTTTAVTIGTNQVVTLAQPLPVSSGGTGSTATPTAGGVGYGTGSAQAFTAAGTAGQVLTSAGTGAPTWSNALGGTTNLSSNYKFYDALVSISATGVTTYNSTSVALDSTTELLLINTDAGVYGCIWNDTTKTMGPATLVATGYTFANGALSARLSATNQVLMVYLSPSTTTIYAKTLTISGTSITANTQATKTTVNLASYSGTPTESRLVKVGSTFVVNYYDPTPFDQYAVAITISGTTVTFGAELAVQAGGATYVSTVVYAYGTNSMMVFGGPSTTTMTIAPIAVSGTTLTLGTVTTITTGNGSYPNFSSAVLTTGRIAFLYFPASTNLWTVAMLTTNGSTITSNAVSTSVSTATSSTIPYIVAASSGRAFYNIFGQQVNVVTDNSGTPALGTALTLGGNSYAACVTSSDLFYVSNSASGTLFYVYSQSGGSPVFNGQYLNITTNVTSVVASSFQMLNNQMTQLNVSTGLLTSSGRFGPGTFNASYFITSFNGSSNTVKEISPYGPSTSQSFRSQINNYSSWGVVINGSTYSTLFIRRYELTN